MGILETGRRWPRARDGAAPARCTLGALWPGCRASEQRVPAPKGLGLSMQPVAAATNTPASGAPNAAMAANEAAFTARFGSGVNIDGCITETSRWSGTGNIPPDRARSRRGERVFSRSHGIRGAGASGFAERAPGHAERVSDGSARDDGLGARVSRGAARERATRASVLEIPNEHRARDSRHGH